MEEKNSKKNRILKIFLIVLAVIISIVLGIIVYDRLTINNQYYIGEKDIRIPIFLYHDIVENDDEVELEYMQTTIEKFKKQMEGLKRLEYHFIDYKDLEEYKKGKQKLYKRSCLITFDDGWDGAYDEVFEYAKEKNIPYTMFVVNENMDKQGFITWNEAREMKESGLVTIASHSINHPDFSKLNLEDAMNNILTSYNEIDDKLEGPDMEVFTYPYGLYKEEQIKELEKIGFIQNLTDNKINKSRNLDLSRLHRCYPLSDSTFKMALKIIYRSIRYN